MTTSPVLACPTCGGRYERPVSRRVFVAELPLELCEPSNRTRHGQPWAAAKRKASLWTHLRAQHGPVRLEPLRGRPLVVCTRHSSVEPDPHANWAKELIDLLCVPKGRQRYGLGLLAGDKRDQAETVQRWERASPGKGRVVVEVWQTRTETP